MTTETTTSPEKRFVVTFHSTQTWSDGTWTDYFDHFLSAEAGRFGNPTTEFPTEAEARAYLATLPGYRPAGPQEAAATERHDHPGDDAPGEEVPA